MPMMPRLPRLPHVESFGRRRTPNAGSTMDSRRVAAPGRMTANVGQGLLRDTDVRKGPGMQFSGGGLSHVGGRPMTDVRIGPGMQGSGGGQQGQGQRPNTDVRYGMGQQGGGGQGGGNQQPWLQGGGGGGQGGQPWQPWHQGGGGGGNQHPWQQGGGGGQGGRGNDRHPWQNGGGGGNNGGGGGGGQGPPGPPAPSQLPLDPYFEAQRRQLEDALAAQLAGLNPAREQIGANQTLQGARLGTNEGVQHQSLLESLASRGAFGGGVMKRDEGDLATDYLRQRQDLANQGAAGYADLASQEGEYRNQYSSGLQEALLALANRSATDEYTPTPHVRDNRSGRGNDRGGRGRGGRRR